MTVECCIKMLTNLIKHDMLFNCKNIYNFISFKRCVRGSGKVKFHQRRSDVLLPKISESGLAQYFNCSCYCFFCFFFFCCCCFFRPPFVPPPVDSYRHPLLQYNRWTLWKPCFEIKILRFSMESSLFVLFQPIVRLILLIEAKQLYSWHNF